MIRVAIVDSGVNFEHPHLRLPARGISLVDGEGFDDPAGHGTCVAALVHWLAPDAELDAIRVLPADLHISGADLARGITVAVERGAHIVNVSIGTRVDTHRALLQGAVEGARAAGALVVAAALPGVHTMLPAGLEGVVAVAPRFDGVLLAHDPKAWPAWTASGEARPFEGQRSNYRGPSMATARVSGTLAALAKDGTDWLQEMRDRLPGRNPS
jgi:thermitase